MKTLLQVIILLFVSAIAKPQPPFEDMPPTPEEVRYEKEKLSGYIHLGMISQKLSFTGTRDDITSMNFPATLRPAAALGLELTVDRNVKNLFAIRLEAGLWSVKTTGRKTYYQTDPLNYREHRFFIDFLTVAPSVGAYYTRVISKNLDVFGGVGITGGFQWKDKSHFEIYYFANDSTWTNKGAKNEFYFPSYFMIKPGAGLILFKHVELFGSYNLIGHLRSASNYLKDHSNPFILRLGYRINYKGF